MQFQLPKINYDDSHTVLFIYLSKSLYGDKNSKTTKGRSLKFGQMISLYMKLCTCIFEASSVVWTDGPKTCDNEIYYVILIIYFRHVCTCAAVAYWLKVPAYETTVIEKVWVQSSSRPSVFLIPKSYWILHTYFWTKALLIFFILAIDMIRGYRVSFFVKEKTKWFFLTV